MTVKELITALLEMPMNSEVKLQIEKDHIDEYGEKCTGWLFCIDEIEKDGYLTCINFTDWRDAPDNNAEKWIPCSERLPKENGDYLICYYDGYITVGYYQNEIGYYPKYWYNQQDEQIWDDDVIAWMPLPEPYKAERSE